MTDTSSHSASGPKLGYYYQAVYGLILILENSDDSFSLRFEALDDIETHAGETHCLSQVHHSLNDSYLTEKTEKLWHTINIWLGAYDPESSERLNFQYITTNKIDPSGPLACLKDSQSSNLEFLEALRKEAERVLNPESGKPSLNKDSKKYKACLEFSKITKTEQQNFIQRIFLFPQTPKVGEVNVLIKKVISPFTLPESRNLIAQQLLEWWDTRAFFSLLNPDESISKIEVTKKLNELISNNFNSHLTDDFSHATPPNGSLVDLDTATKQIILVDGSSGHISRASRDKWRATSQREKWLDENLSNSYELAIFDSRLAEEWEDLFITMIDESDELTEQQKKTEGRKLLDWSHSSAPSQLPSIREGWREPFLVRGTYQILSGEKRVGWHPDYESLLSDDDK
ncbi:ABC-three component system protein [Alloalcanivorax venustensis]|uniref:ABC-three component system protein n=1 Tax=Alloalcanivorax venustensis TaxID=172371 RepID=UPI0035162D64